MNVDDMGVNTPDTNAIQSTNKDQSEQITESETIEITKEDLLGEWIIDSEYTMHVTGMSLWDIYG